jgi:hypothetical protein
MKKILLVTNIPNHYRIPLFNELNRTLKAAGFQLKVIFAALSYSRRLEAADMSQCGFEYIILKSNVYTSPYDNEKTSFSYTNLSHVIKLEKPELIIVSGFSPATVKIFMLSFI